MPQLQVHAVAVWPAPLTAPEPSVVPEGAAGVIFWMDQALIQHTLSQHLQRPLQPDLSETVACPAPTSTPTRGRWDVWHEARTHSSIAAPREVIVPSKLTYVAVAGPFQWCHSLL